jgi:hypothetical protein
VVGYAVAQGRRGALATAAADGDGCCHSRSQP